MIGWRAEWDDTKAKARLLLQSLILIPAAVALHVFGASDRAVCGFLLAGCAVIAMRWGWARGRELGYWR